MVLTCVAIFVATLFYNIINGMSSIFVARGLIKVGALFDATRNVVYVLILGYVILEVKENYWLLIPLFLGYGAGMIISGEIINRMKLGSVTITAFLNGDKLLARDFAEHLSGNGIPNTNFIGTGSRSKTIMILAVTRRKDQNHVIRTIKRLAKSSDLRVNITVAETAEWQGGADYE